MATSTRTTPTPDRASVFRAGLALARQHRAAGLTWARALSAGLRTAWAQARAALALARIARRLFTVRYIDLKGATTERTVEITGARRAPHGILVETYCTLRHAVRHLRADGVAVLTDVRSGRVCPNPRAFLSTLAA